MKKYFVGMLLMLFASLVIAQDGKVGSTQKSRPNLNGRWTLDFSEDSKGKSVKATHETVLDIKQLEPEIKFLETVAGENDKQLTYYTDGRGEENPSEISIHTGQGDGSEQADQKLESKTKWDGDKLVSRAMLQRTVMGHVYRLEIVKEWKLSKDGGSLTIISRTTNLNPNSGTRSPSSGAGIMLPSRPSESKRIYRRDAAARTSKAEL